jgi:cytosine/uracil/thiamine/allantoin permease
MFWEPLRPIYNWSWFVGFGVAGGLYWVLMLGAPPPAGVRASVADIAPPR